MTKANWVEKSIVNNFIWVLVQKKRIVPLWGASMELPNDSRILEVGCGRGAGAVLLIESFKPSRLDAFDVDEVMVKKAKRYVSGAQEGQINVYVGDVTAIESPDSVYDAVFDFFTLHHVEDWSKALSEIGRVLKPGGFFAFGEIYGEASNANFIRNLLHSPSEGKFDRTDWVRGLAENRLRLMEKKSNLWGYGMVGVARRV